MKPVKFTYSLVLWLALVLLLAACSASKNTARSRWWQSFNTRYNVYYNGNMAYIDGMLEKETGNHDNYTELLPLYTVSNKNSKELGKGNFERAILKSEKAIQLHSIKRRPTWDKSRRKTQRDIEWLNRKEYNPFMWRVWMLMGRSQFHKGDFDQAASTFSYMARLYRTQPHIYAKARAWLAKTYIQQGWMYDAEDVIRNMSRDSMDWRAVKEWDYTHTLYHLHAQEWSKAISYLQKVIKHEMRRKQKARQWFLMGQLQRLVGNRDAAYKAFKKAASMHASYELDFNARIAQTEVLAQGQAKKMIAKLRRMAVNDNNRDYLDQVFYAIGNIYLAQGDTANAISAYENGGKRATRSGIEKGVLMLKLGDVYWQKQRFADARRCYNEALGMLDKERTDYEVLSQRSKVLDELVPHIEAVQLQDSLQRLATMAEPERNAAIDRVIAALKKKEKEERDAQYQETARQTIAQNSGSSSISNNQTPAQRSQQGSGWYFYNPITVSQGKATFEKQWGKRDNIDNWQRLNKAAVALNNAPNEMPQAQRDSLMAEDTRRDSMQRALQTAGNDPHKREYYLAQIPFTTEQRQASDQLLTEGLFHSGVIFKDKLNLLNLSEKALRRLTNAYPHFDKMPQVYYHLFLLYMQKGDKNTAHHYSNLLKQHYPKHELTELVNDPYYFANAQRGEHIEDSIYAATYDAFKAEDYNTVRRNAQVSATKFKHGANRDKFLFVEALAMLHDANIDACTSGLQTLVQQYPQSELSKMAAMIVNGIMAGKQVQAGGFDLNNVWQRRTAATNAEDSLKGKQFSNDRNANFLFVLVYQPDSVNENQLLFALAKYNFTNYLVRNFEIRTETDNGLRLMTVSGFRNFDEALQYARQLQRQTAITKKLKNGRSIVISEDNMRLLGREFSFDDYDQYYAKHFAPLKVSTFQLLNEPAEVVQPEAPVRLPTVEEVDRALDNDLIVPDEKTPLQPEDDTYPIADESKQGANNQKATSKNNNDATVIETPQQPQKQPDDGTIVIEDPAPSKPKAQQGSSTTTPKVQQSVTPKAKTTNTPTQSKGKTPTKTETKPPKQPTKTDKKEDTGIDFKDDLDKKGKKPETKKTSGAKQDSNKTPAKQKQKNNDPDDEYYDLEGF